MASDLVAIENRLWAAADQLWANTGLKPAEFSTPVLGLIFLRYADKRFTELTQALHDQGTPADEMRARWTTRPRACSTCPTRPGSRTC